MKRWLVLAMTLVVALGVLAGCGSDTSKSGKHAGLGLFWFGETLDPTHEWDAWTLTRIGAGETLATVDKDMTFQPQLADSWENVDPMTWKFHIRENVKFHNGVVMTPDMVKASIERTIANSKRSKDAIKIESITVDGQNLIFKTTEPNAHLLADLTEPAFVIVDVADTKDMENAPILTGPYKIVKHTKQEEIQLEQHKEYWGGTPGLDTLTVKNIEDHSKRAMALQSGDVDMAISIGPGEYSIFQNDKKFTIYEVASLRDVFVRMGQKGKLRNPNLRAALIAAADRESYAKNLMKDTFVAGKAPLPPSIDYGFNQLRDPNKYNVERAKELLKQEGYEDTNGDGIVDKDGENLVLDFYAYTTRPELPLYAEALQADYKKIGVDLQIKIVDYAVIDTLSQSGDYDMIISSVVTANTGQPVWFLKQYWGIGVETNGSGFSNPRFDELLALGESSSDPVVRRNAVINAQQLMLDNAVALFLGYPKINIVGNKRIDGIKITPSEYYIITKDLKKK